MRYRDPLKQILRNTCSHWDRDSVPSYVRVEFLKVLDCRTAALGAEVFASENGELIVYHTCKSRSCSSCGFWATKRWIPERVAALPPVPYKGITFSMPDVLWDMFRLNRVLADALPALAASSVEAFVTAKHGLRIGIIGFLHTFNGRLEFNSHVHTMVTAGGWQASSGTWVRSVYYDRDLVTVLWRTAVLDLLRKALHAGVLTTYKTFEEVEELLSAQERWWSVKIKSIDSIEHFFQYSGRYASPPSNRATPDHAYRSEYG